MARHKVRWPIARHNVSKPQFTGDHLADLFVAWDRCSTELEAWLSERGRQ